MWKIAVFTFSCLCAGVTIAGRLPRNDKDDNLQGTGEPCEINDDCTTGICTSGTCDCNATSVRVGGTCLKRASALGDGCKEDIQCSEVNGTCVNETCQSNSSSPGLCDDRHSENVNGECRCLQGYIESDSRTSCLELVENIGGKCESTQQCKHLNAVCEEEICKVLSEFEATEDSTGSQDTSPTLARPSIRLGSHCDADSECMNVSNSVCKDSACKCVENFTPGIDSHRCLPLAKQIGDLCSIDDQCSRLPHSSCVAGKCVSVIAASSVSAASGGKQGKSRKDKEGNGGTSPLGSSPRILIAAILLIVSANLP